MNIKEAIHSAKLHSATTHARAKADAVEGKTEQARTTLTFDGFGINGPDEYRSRLATFTSREEGKRWGPLLAAAPDLLEALGGLLQYTGGWDETDPTHPIVIARKAIAKAKGSL